MKMEAKFINLLKANLFTLPISSVNYMVEYVYFLTNLSTPPNAEDLLLKMHTTIYTILYIGIGSFVGGTLRYLLSSFISLRFSSAFPHGTFWVNIIGCFVIGVVFSLIEKGQITGQWPLFITVGVLGGFTTFSSFSNEAILLIRNGESFTAIGYIFLSIALGLAATFVGYLLSRLL